MSRITERLWKGEITAMAVSVCCGSACTAAAVLASSVLIMYVMKDMAIAGGLAGAALAAGAYGGAFVNGKYRRRRGLLRGALCGAVMYGILAICGMVYSGEAAGIKKLLLLAVFGAAGGVAGVNSKRPKGLMDQ